MCIIADLLLFHRLHCDTLEINLLLSKIRQFKQYLQNYMAIPVVLKDFIRKHTINHFHIYVQHLDDENIEKNIKQSRKLLQTNQPRKNKKIVQN